MPVMGFRRKLQAGVLTKAASDGLLPCAAGLGFPRETGEAGSRRLLSAKGLMAHRPRSGRKDPPPAPRVACGFPWGRQRVG